MTNCNVQVLIVDDAETINKIMRPTLVKELGFTKENIFEAHDGQKALEILDTTKIDLVLCEWNIPKISGLELLKTVRKHDRLASMPFVLVTSESDQDYILKAAQEEVSQYVVKPFTIDSFSNKLNKALHSDDRRSERRYQATKTNKITVGSKGKSYTSGKVLNISRGGLLAKLIVQRKIIIYDELDLQISLIDSSLGKKILNTIHGELIRIEINADRSDKNSANYAFRFIGLDKAQIKFLETLKLWIEQETSENERP